MKQMLLTRSNCVGEDLYMAFLAYRSTKYHLCPPYAQQCLKGSSIRIPYQQPNVKGKRNVYPRVQLTMTIHNATRKPYSEQDKLFLC